MKFSWHDRSFPTRSTRSTNPKRNSIYRFPTDKNKTATSSTPRVTKVHSQGRRFSITQMTESNCNRHLNTKRAVDIVNTYSSLQICNRTCRQPLFFYPRCTVYITMRREEDEVQTKRIIPFSSFSSPPQFSSWGKRLLGTTTDGIIH